MKILSFYTSLPSSVAVYKDGHIAAAVHEERFSRLKNDERFPEQSIQYCLSEVGIQSADLDAVAIASYLGFSFEDTVTRRSQWSPADYLKEQYERWLPITLGQPSKSRSPLDIFPEKVDFDLSLGRY